jgi:hypothetical protein
MLEFQPLLGQKPRRNFSAPFNKSLHTPFWWETPFQTNVESEVHMCRTEALFLTSPLGANFDPRGEVVHHGWYIFVPWGWNYSLGVKVSPEGEILCSPLHVS